MLYDTRDPWNWSLLHKLPAVGISHIMTDMDISKDETGLLYTTLNSVAHILNIETLKQQSLAFSPGDDSDPAIIACKYYRVRELLAGNRSSELMIYDLF